MGFSDVDGTYPRGLDQLDVPAQAVLNLTGLNTNQLLTQGHGDLAAVSALA
ncbi:MAG: hypothetical protein SOR40_08890 [Rothia sp. (in: high G+C Gram-positive bacteria)]|nr:hypothetical protein [Rothia sp. (in: high G+C Gram-positive bacteria)]